MPFELLRYASDGLVLDLTGERLSEDMVTLLCEDIQNKHLLGLKHVYLNRCSLNVPALSVFFNLIIHHLPHLESLHLKANHLPKEAGLLIAKLLVSNSSLKTLDLSENNLSDIGIASVAGAFTVDLTHLETNKSIPLLSLQTLNLAYNNFGDAAALALSRGLTQLARHAHSNLRSPSIKSLNLSGNKLGDKSAVCLGQLLVSLASKEGGQLTLEELALNNNPLSSIGITALLKDLSVDHLLASGASTPPLNRLSLDQCYPNITVLDAIGACSVTHLRIHFSENDATEAVRHLHFHDIFFRLKEALRVNNYLQSLYLGHLPSVLEMEWSNLKEQQEQQNQQNQLMGTTLRSTSTYSSTSPLDFEEFQATYESFLSLSEQIVIPHTIAEFSNKELRTPKKDELSTSGIRSSSSASSSLSLESLAQQQRAFEALRQQHQGVFRELAEEVHKLSEQQLEPPPPPSTTILASTSSSFTEIAPLPQNTEPAKHSLSRLPLPKARLPAVSAEREVEYIDTSTTKPKREIVIDEDALQLLIQRAVEQALRASTAAHISTDNSMPSIGSALNGRGSGDVNLVKEDGVIDQWAATNLPEVALSADKLMLLSSRVDMLESCLRNAVALDSKVSGASGGKASNHLNEEVKDQEEEEEREHQLEVILSLLEGMDERMSKLERRIHSVEVRQQQQQQHDYVRKEKELELASRRDDESTAQSMASLMPIPGLAGGRQVEVKAVVTDIAQRLGELEKAVEVEHEFSLKLLDLLLAQQQQKKVETLQLPHSSSSLVGVGGTNGFSIASQHLQPQLRIGAQRGGGDSVGSGSGRSTSRSRLEGSSQKPMKTLLNTTNTSIGTSVSSSSIATNSTAYRRSVLPSKAGANMKM